MALISIVKVSDIGVMASFAVFSASSSAPAMMATGNQNHMRTRTAGATAAPMAKPYLEQTDCELVSGSGVGSSEVGLSLPTIVVLETWTVANWQNGKWLGNYYFLLPFCNLPVWTVGTWNYEARTNG
nr:hypothetical protein Iba_chr11eCG6120 [Ipomoea batatas]